MLDDNGLMIAKLKTRGYEEDDSGYYWTLMDAQGRIKSIPKKLLKKLQGEGEPAWSTI